MLVIAKNKVRWLCYTPYLHVSNVLPEVSKFTALFISSARTFELVFLFSGRLAKVVCFAEFVSAVAILGGSDISSY